MVSHVIRYFEILPSRFYTLYDIAIICPLITSQRAIFQK